MKDNPSEIHKSFNQISQINNQFNNFINNKLKIYKIYNKDLKILN